MTKTAKPAGFPWLSPYIIVKDVAAAAQFYQKAFGFNVKDIPKDQQGNCEHAELTYQDQVIMIGKEGAWGGTTKTPKSSGVDSPINLYVYCDDVDEFYQHAIAAGAKSIVKPDDMFWGDRMCNLQDIDGYNWSFATRAGEHK